MLTISGDIECRGVMWFLLSLNDLIAAVNGGISPSSVVVTRSCEDRQFQMFHLCRSASAMRLAVL